MKPRVVLITGASRGIGKAIALEFAKKECDLILNCIKSERELVDFKNSLEAEYGIRCMTFIGDMGDYGTVSTMFDEIYTLFHTIDIVVNNAGISHIGLLSDMTGDEWDSVIRTNLSSVFNCSKFAIPAMVRQKSGKIMNISSVWGNVGASCEVAYSAAKGGMNAFTKALAKELAPSNIQVNAIACGAIDTDMNRCFSIETMNSLTTEIPAGRLGKPDEVAKLVYLLCNKNMYLTGQVIGLDGGWV